MHEIPVIDAGPVRIGQAENAEAAAGYTVFVAPDWMCAEAALPAGKASCPIPWRQPGRFMPSFFPPGLIFRNEVISKTKSIFLPLFPAK